MPTPEALEEIETQYIALADEEANTQDIANLFQKYLEGLEHFKER